MSNKYLRILLLISILVITRPASAQGSASKASTTNSYDGLITEWETVQFSSGTNSQRSTSYTTLFFIKDHLGSIRTVTDAQGHILESNTYYPFGLQTNQNLAFPTITTSLATLYPNYITSLPARRDLYNRKEIQTAAGTDYLDYGFRQYDPFLFTLFIDGIQFITKLKSNMKGQIMTIGDRILLRKRALIETINDELKNMAQIEHSRHRSVVGFTVNLMAGLAAYSFFPKKPMIDVERVSPYENGVIQLSLF